MPVDQAEPQRPDWFEAQPTFNRQLIRRFSRENGLFFGTAEFGSEVRLTARKWRGERWDYAVGSSSSVGRTCRSTRNGTSPFLPPRRTQMKITVVLAVMLSSFASAQITSNLNRTVFWSQKAIAVQASCQTSGCLAYATIFCSVGAPNCANTDPTERAVICPGPAGGSCTFHIALEASLFLGNEATLTEVTGLYHFLVDGAPPNPGPAPNSNGFSEFGCTGSSDIGTGCVGQTEFISNYVSVVATVKNAYRNQAHAIQVDAVCTGVSGCQLVVNRAAARIDVFKQ